MTITRRITLKIDTIITRKRITTRRMVMTNPITRRIIMPRRLVESGHLIDVRVHSHVCEKPQHHPQHGVIRMKHYITFR